MARLVCRNPTQPDWNTQCYPSLRLSKSASCQFMCGKRVVGTADVWRDDNVVFKKWRIRLRAGNQDAQGRFHFHDEKIVKGGSPQRVCASLEKWAAEVFKCNGESEAAPALSRRRRKYDLPY